MSSTGQPTPSPGLRAKWQALPRRRRWAVMAVLAAALYLVGGFVVLPAILHSVLPAQAGLALGRTVTLAEVRFNPLTHQLTLEGLAIAEAAVADDGANATKAADAPPFVSVDRLVVNASSFSLLRLAVLVDEVRLTRPRVHLVHSGDGQFNFSDILQRFTGSEEAREQVEKLDPAGPFPLVVSNFVIEDGALDFEDGPKGRTHTIKGLDLTVPFTSTLPGDSDVDVEPMLRAVVNGTPVEASGRTRPFAQTMQTDFALRLADLSLAEFADYVPLPPSLRLAGGALSVDMDLVFERTEGVLPKLFLQGRTRLRDVALNWADGRRLAGFAALTVDLERFSLREGLLRATRIQLEQPYAALTRGDDGALDWLRAAADMEAQLQSPAKAEKRPRAAHGTNATLADPAAQAAKPEDDPGFTFEALRVEVEGGRLDFTDNEGGRGFRKTVTPIALTVDNFSTDPKASPPASFALALGPEDGESLAVAGTATLTPLTVNATLNVSGVVLASYEPYYRDVLPLRLTSGTARLGAECSVAEGRTGAPLRAVVDNLAFGLSRLALAKPEAEKPLLTLEALELTGGKAELATRAASAEALTLSGGELAMLRDASGIDLAALFSGPAPQKAAPRTKAPRKTPAPKTSEAPKAEEQWTATLARVTLADFAVLFTDGTLPAPATQRLHIGELTATGISTAMNEPLHYALDATLGAKGRVRTTGTLTQGDGTKTPGAVKGSLELAGLALADFGPYVSAFSPLTLDRGIASLSGSYNVALGDTVRTEFNGGLGLRGVTMGAGGKPLAALEALDVTGLTLEAPELKAALEALDLKNFAVRDPQRPEDAATVGAFALRGASVDLAERTLAVVAADVQTPVARLAIDADGILNLARILARATGQPAPTAPEAPADAAAAPATPDSPAASAPAPAPAAEAAPGFSVALDSLTVDGGALHFTDESLTPPFSSALENLSLRLEGLSTEPGAQARLSANATLDGLTPFTVSGQASPSDLGLNPEVLLTLHGLNLTHISPYSLRAIAYPVTEGKLFADMRISVSERKVSAENTLRLKRFELGSKQKVEGAIDAPVKLAVALLRDGNGDIVLDIPVRGDLDDPEFRLGKVVFRAVMNLLVKAVTSPFALIGSMFGGGAQNLDALDMPPGRAEISSDNHVKLATVAKALAERPGLTLELYGKAVPGDLPALAELRFQRAVRNNRYNELKDQDQTPDSVEGTPLSPEEYIEALTDAYEDGEFDKPKNAFGFTREQPVQEMERMLRESLTPTPDDLPALAQERARLVRDALLANGVDPGRVYLVDAPAGKKDAEPGVRLSLQ